MRHLLLALTSLLATDALALSCAPSHLQGILPADGADDVPSNAELAVRYQGWLPMWLGSDAEDVVAGDMEPPFVLEGPDGVPVPGTWEVRDELTGIYLHFRPDGPLEPGAHVFRPAPEHAADDVISTFTVVDTLDDTPPALPTLSDPRWGGGEGFDGEDILGLTFGEVSSDEPVRLLVRMAGDDAFTNAIERSAVGEQAHWLDGDCDWDTEVGALDPDETWISVRAVDVAGNVSEELVFAPGDVRVHGQDLFAGCNQAPFGIGWAALGLLPLAGLRRRRS